MRGFGIVVPGAFALLSVEGLFIGLRALTKQGHPTLRDTQPGFTVPITMGVPRLFLSFG